MNILQPRIFDIQSNNITRKVTYISDQIDRQTKINRDMGSYL